MTRKTKGERLMTWVDVVLASLTFGAGVGLLYVIMLLIGIGAGWILIPIAAVIAVTVASITYLETGSDVYK